jgi:hypothetical protein
MSKIEDLFKSIEEKQDFPVISIIYNPEGDIRRDDWEKLEKYLKEINSNQGVVILNCDTGGNFYGSIDMSIRLKENFSKKLIVIIPFIAASAATNLVWPANKLLMSKQSYLTQADILFRWDTKEFPFSKYLRACKELNNTDPEIKKKAHFYYDYVYKSFETLLTSAPSLITHVLPKEPKKRSSFILRLADEILRKGKHSDKVTSAKLKKLQFNIIEIEETNAQWKEIVEYANLVKNELLKDKKRFAIQNKKNIVFFDF